MAKTTKKIVKKPAAKKRKPVAKSGQKRRKAPVKRKSTKKVALTQRSNNRQKDNEPTPWALTQFSVAAKIILFSAVAYLFALAAYLVCKWFFIQLFPKEVLGLSSEWILWGIQILVIAAAVTVGAKLFLINPINRIKKAIRDVRRGNFLARAEIESRDEIGELAIHFNDMLSHLTELNADKIETEYELLLAKKDLKYKNHLAKRGNQLKKANQSLEVLVKDFSLLYDIGQKINSTIEISGLYLLLQDLLPRQLDLQKFAILRIDKKKEFLSVKAAHGFEDPELIFNLSFRVGEGISGEVATTGEIAYLPDVASDDRFLYYRGENIDKGSFISVPLKYKKEVLGVMNCSRAEMDAFSEDDKRILTLVANQIALAVENAQLYTKTRELSVRDELLGIYNRRHFQKVLKMEWKRATRFRRPISLLMIDIDHFKDFNDTYGHLQGDRVLKGIADILSRNLRELDTIARFGGEEFIVLLPDTDREGAMVVGEKLRQLVEMERFDEAQQPIMQLTISVGISTFADDAREMEDLIDHADVALYEAKDGGRNKVVLYSDALEVEGPVIRPTIIPS